MNEKEIRLKDLFIEILLKWRGVIVSMLIMGILIGAAGYLRAALSILPLNVRMETLAERLEERQAERSFGKNEWLEQRLRSAADLTAEIQEYQKAGASDSAEAVRQLLSDNGVILNEKQLDNVNYVLYYEKLYQNRLASQEQSILLKIDPDKVQRAETTFLVMSEDSDKAYRIEALYEDMILSAELLDKLGRQAGVSANHIAEIISVSRNSADTKEGSNAFRVTLSHYDNEMCQKLLQTVIDYIDSKHSSLTEKWGAHDVTVLDQWMGSISDKAILNAQTSAEKSILDSRSTIFNSQNAFSEEEWYYYSLLTSGKLAGNPRETHVRVLASAADPVDIATVISAGISSSPRVNMRYVLLGMILGAFVYVFWTFVRYVLGDKLQAADLLDELYGIPQLGCIPDEGSKKRLFGFMDQWILALRYRNQRKLSQTEALKLTAAMVKMAAQREQTNEICFIGCGIEGNTLQICWQLRDMLEKENLAVHVLGDMLYNVEGMKKIRAAKGVVLVETEGVSLYAEIAREIEMLKRQGAGVIGGIIVE